MGIREISLGPYSMPDKLVRDTAIALKTHFDVRVFRNALMRDLATQPLLQEVASTLRSDGFFRFVASTPIALHLSKNLFSINLCFNGPSRFQNSHAVLTIQILVVLSVARYAAVDASSHVESRPDQLRDHLTPPVPAVDGAPVRFDDRTLHADRLGYAGCKASTGCRSVVCACRNAYVLCRVDVRHDVPHVFFVYAGPSSHYVLSSLLDLLVQVLQAQFTRTGLLLTIVKCP
jgi:hypothetical protein